MRPLAFALLLGFFASNGFAQNWGTGQWGGMQGCDYPMSAGPGASNVSDEIRELQQNLAETKRELTAKRSEKKRVDREVEKARQDITDTVQSSYAEFALSHIENSQNCESYGGDDGSRARSRRQLKTGPFKAEEWASICLPGNGSVSSELCTEYRNADSKGSSSLCTKALSTFKKKNIEALKIQSAIDSLQSAVERANDDIKQARLDKTESGICIECMQRNNGYQMQQPQTNWTGIAAGVGMGLAGMYAGYQTNKTMAQYNSNLGYPTQPTSSFGMGYPYFAAAAYGAMGSGLGQGGFGCGSGIGGTGNMNGFMGMGGPFGSASLYGGNGGAFGYPQGMMGMQQMGGGMYNPGMGAWGMAGPMGMQGMQGMQGMPNMQSMYPNSMLGGQNSQMQMSLQMEMNSLMNRMQSLQSGSGMYGNMGGGFGGYPGIGGSGSLGGYGGLGNYQGVGAYGNTGTYPGIGMTAGMGSYSSSGSITGGPLGASTVGMTSPYATTPYSTSPYNYSPYSNGAYPNYNSGMATTPLTNGGR